jgi:ATP-dependent RNA helicase RhlE
MGFIRDIKKVMLQLPKKRQNLLFSATFSDEIKALADGLLNNPAMIEVAKRNQTAELITQKAMLVDKAVKRFLLAHLIKQGDWHQVLVFCRTKHGANRLAEQLNKDGITSMAIHGNKSQGARTRALSEFKGGTLQVLVATDIAARGLDIEQLPHVVNFELPNVPEDYVHRIGRTGRAGALGEALSLVSPDETSELKAIERLIKQQLPRVTPVGFVPPAPGSIPPEPPRVFQNQPRSNRGGGGGGSGRNASAPRNGNSPARSGSGSNSGPARSGPARSGPARSGSGSGPARSGSGPAR